MNLPFQGEIVDINKRAEELRAQQQAAQQAAEKKRRAEEQVIIEARRAYEQHVGEVSAFASRFLRWVRRHNIPPSMQWRAYDGDTFWRGKPKYSHYNGWLVANIQWSERDYSVDHDAYISYQELYVIGSESRTLSRLDRSTIKRYEPTYQAYENSKLVALTAEDYRRITIESINEGIALLVTKNNIPWDA